MAEKKKSAPKAEESKAASQKAVKAKSEKPAKKAKKAKKAKPGKTGKRVGMKLLGGVLLSKMARGGAQELRNNAEEVNKLNVFPVPDGDTGDNMRMTIESGIAAIENLGSDDLAEVMKVFSHGMLLGARGNSGVILSQFFAGTAKGFEGVEQAGPAELGYAFSMGVQQAYTSVMTPTEGTILTVAREAVEYASSRVTPNSTVRSFFADMVKEMNRSLDRTPELLTALKEAGVVDSGGAGLLYIIDGFNRVLNDKPIPEGEEARSAISTAVKEAPKPAVTPENLDAFGPDSVMTYGYCTELLVRLQNSKTDIESFDLDALKAFLAGEGDSIVAFRTESVVKIHVHTFAPERVLAHCRTFGEFLAVKIENMSLQHSSSLEEEPAHEEAPAASVEKKRYGVVAVCMGEGIKSIYREMGTDVVVEGGQTQNPSTNDFLDAFSHINAEHIFVFPNNGNIFMAAQQAAELYEEATVHVIPSKSVGCGYVALSVANFEEPDADAVVASMEEAMQNVTYGCVSPSIRDAEINGVHIAEGDTIGILQKEIIVSCADRTEAAVALVKKLMEGDRFMLTVFCGKDATDQEREQFEQILKANHPNAEIYLIDGGQDIYPYSFVAE